MERAYSLFVMWKALWGTLLLLGTGGVFASVDLEKDFAIRENIAKILRATPEKCPLARDMPAYQKILDRLRSNLEDFACKEDDSGEKAIADVQNELSRLSALGTAGTTGSGTVTSGAAATPPTEQQIALQQAEIISDTVSRLIDLGRTRECKEDVQKQSFLGGVADTISGITPWAVFADENSLWLLTGGTVLSSFFTLLDGLFARDYDWKKDEDRELFGKLNCAFYGIRLEMDKMGIFRLGSEQTIRGEERAYEELQNLRQEHSVVRSEIAQLDQGLEVKREVFFREQVSVAEETLYGHAQYLLQQSVPDHARWLMVAMRSAEIQTALGQIQVPLVIEQALPKVNEALDSAMGNYLEQREARAQMGILQGFFYLYIELYQQRLLAVEAQWQQGPLREHNSQVTAKQARVEELSLEIESKQLQVDLLSFQNTKDQYRLDDSGVGQLVGIHDAYEETMNKIYGGHGRGFLEHLKKESFDSHNIFEDRYKDFEERFTQESEDGLPGQDLAQVCMGARSLAHQWDEANSWSQQAYNFVMTNRRLFHDLDDGSAVGAFFKTVFSFGIVDRNRPKLRDDAHSAVYASALIAGHRERKVGIIKQGGGEVIPEVGALWEAAYSHEYREGSVGDLMIKVYQQSENNRKLEGFVEEHCEAVGV